MENIEAIGLIRQMIKDNEEDGGVEFGNKDKEALTLAISALEKQEADSWIPVTERPPEEDGRYLITEETYCATVLEGYFCRTRDGEPYWGYSHVTAWRPLPEPYTEKN